MGVYQFGTAIVIDETFYVETVPGDFDTAIPTDPTTVTFSVRDPDADLTSYVFGVDAEVTNPSVGRYVLELDVAALALAGEWHYRCAGTGAVEAASEGEFTILASSVLTTPVAEPVRRPCQSWCDAADVAAFGETGVGSDWGQLEWACEAAAEFLYEASGRQFSGVCDPVTERPFADGCGCWDWILSPMSPGAPQVNLGWGFWAGAWGWGFDGCSSPCGCGTLSRALLTGYPIVAVDEVKIDGAVVDASEYRLDNWKWLTRLADADGNPRFWPACQRLDLPDDEPGTWSVTYRHGQTPPVLGQKAAAQLAYQLWLACSGSDACLLPSGVTRIERQGLTIERSPFTAWGLIDGKWATGLTLVDAFLASSNPAGLRRRSSVWSPDGPQYSTRVG